MSTFSERGKSTDRQKTAEQANALYDQGMAHYQRREWGQALDCFTRLKQIRPDWPGINSLIDESRWFLQLEQVDSGDANGSVSAQEDTGRGQRGIRWLLPVAIVIGLLGALTLWQGWIPGIDLGRSLEREALYNRGQASLAVGDYAGAREAFAALSVLDPGNPAAQQGLERASRLEKLAQSYQEAEAAIEAADWDTAEANLLAILALDPAYGEAAGLLTAVIHQRDASQLFDKGVSAYDSGDYSIAIQYLSRLADLDPAYQRDAVRELLFVLYLSEGRALLATPDAGSDTIRQAIGRFGNALALRPRNVEAGAESQVANQYLAARQAYERQDWRQAENHLRALLEQDSEYADGQVRELYFQVLTARADQARSAGLLDDAFTDYQQALALSVQDASAARNGLDALSAIFTPTPAATATPTPSPLPTPFVEVAADILNVRLGPGTDFPVLGQVRAGERMALVGRNESGDWVVVCCVNGQPGWLAALLVTTNADIDSLPVGLPPTPVATDTPTATQTATPTPTETPGETGSQPGSGKPSRPPPTPTRTLVPPTGTAVPSTDTPVPSTDTPIPSTDTPVPPTDTPVPPTDTPVPPTDTPVPPTDTPVPPTSTPTNTPKPR
ncbi:MAG: SH3 domain-containing protein [Chloroflexota bacterium]|nr:SH3 domain-containing protein [Chloroflexota bacterium]